ncbi:MAG: hypothetical protein FWE02_07275 [Defluviitaleaceae bacterium]|nr:hypothetical protein [Defluviitaleaceae bacterium]
MQKWEIDDSITEAERASHDAMKVARERLSGSIAGTLAISLQIKSRINPDGMPGEPIGMLILFVLTLAIIRLTTLCFYRYFLIKVHCPDLNEKNSEEEIDVFMKMEERNHLDIDNPESKD